MEYIDKQRKDYLSWDEFFMGVAILASERSKDPNTQVGACIVSADNRILSVGYNGTPNGYEDRFFPWDREGDELNTKYMYVVHAERNAILNYRGNIKDFDGAKLYVTLFPCNECAKEVIQVGIKDIIYLDDKYARSNGVMAAKRMLDVCDVNYSKLKFDKSKITEGSPITASKRVVRELKSKINLSEYKVVGVGTTGSARKLIGTILGANVIKNEITAHAIGTMSIYPEVRTIFEIGGQDSKIILIDNGIVTDYAMNTLCAAGTGSFLSSQAKRLGIPIEEFGNIAITSRKPTKIAARCTVFAESDLVHKSQMGHKKEDIIAGLCYAIVNNYLNNVGKGKKIVAPIVFQGGVSKNIGVVKAFEDITGEKIYVDNNSHLMGALGVAILSKKQKEIEFSFDIEDVIYETKGTECRGCSNNCEIIEVLRDKRIIDAWGNRCPKGELVHK